MSSSAATWAIVVPRGVLNANLNESRQAQAILQTDRTVVIRGIGSGQSDTLVVARLHRFVVNQKRQPFARNEFADMAGDD